MSISRVVNNIASLNANRNLNNTQRSLSKSIERLSSGLRINRAGDDAAGLSVANNLRTQVQGLDQAVDNASSGINLINVAEGALEETTTRLNRIRQLSIQAANTAVNDLNARRALQDEVFQSIDEITRIANTTQFTSNFLLNGDFSITTNTIDGQEEIGLSIDASPVASTLASGKSFLNIVRTNTGTTQIIAGDGVGEIQTLNTGIRNQTDIAVSMAHFSDAQLFGGSGADATDSVSGIFFNGVSISAHAGSGVYDVFTFEGVLSDGVTKFNGTLSLSGQTVMGVATDTAATDAATSLIGTINRAIDQAEKALFGVTTTASVPTAFRTTVSLGAGANIGRLLFFNDGNYTNESSINITLLRDSNFVSQSNGVTRSGAIGIDSALSGAGQIGNTISSITGSTFGVGQFDIEVYNVQAAQAKKMESTITFYDGNGAIMSRTASITGTGTKSLVINGAFVEGIYTGGTTLQSGDTITLAGTNADGTTFEAAFTFDNTDTAGNQNEVDTNLNDFSFRSISGLIQELNYRTRDYTVTNNTIGLADGVQSRFEDALFTFTSSGVLQLVDDIGRSDSEMQFTLTFNSAASSTNKYTFQDDGVLTREGFAESATFRIAGGEEVRAEAGQMVTLVGEESTIQGVAQPKVTFRVGSGFAKGVDKLEATPSEFVGQLNGGEKVTFQNGNQDVVFIDGNSGGNRGVARFVTVDFDGVLDVTQRTDGLVDTGRTIIISTVNTSMNFHVGAFSEQSFTAAIGDLTSENLGFGRGSGRTVADIDVTTLNGANESIRIIDEALAQVNKTRSILGAATNRLEAAISNMSVSSENLTASESRIRDVDIAKESTEYATNQVLLQSGLSVLAQSNFTSQGFLALLG